jgi:hypothetical protein
VERCPEEDAVDAEDEMIELHCEVPGLINKVIELVRSETDVDKRRLLEEYPELLSDQSDDVLKQIEDAHRRLGREQDANNCDGLRFKLSRTKLYGFEHACLEQVVLTAFVRMPKNNPAAYLEQVTSRYPELLRPEADRAILSLKELYADSDVMGVFLDVLLESVREQRTRYAALYKKDRKS